MKRFELVSLKLKNFKGLKSFVLEADSESVRVFGDNATGKTTLFDACNWLLFDKDSHNKKDFSIKTLDAEGKEIHGLDHEIEGSFLLDGRKITLRKVYKEKWTKKQGAAHREFTGHTTDYYVDGVPAKKKEYVAKVSEIVDENIFKLLTSPSYFNEQLHWEERRNTLLEVCGDITNEDVIASDSKLEKLSKLLGDRSIEDHKKVIAAKKREINKELDLIPVRIDEIKHNLPDVNGLDQEEITQKIADASSLIEAKEDEISRIRNGAEVSEKQKQLREAEAALMEIKNKHNAENQDKVNAKERLFYDVRRERDQVEYSIDSLLRKKKANSEEIKELEVKADRLRDQWHEINDRKFHEKAYQHDENCPTCGQSLPEEEIKRAHQKMQEKFEAEKATFNRRKSEELEQIVSQGKQGKARIEQIQSDNERIEKELSEKQATVSQYEERLSDLQKEISSLKANVSSIEENTEYKQKTDEINGIKADIESLKTSMYEQIGRAQEELEQIKADKRALELDFNKFDQHSQADKRINQLSVRERELAEQYESLEEELFLTEEFIRTKVNLLEEKINSKFKYARFKLFDTQINDGLKETCETTYKGVPYGSGLNNAARINVGLDIINTLSEHYGFSAPIFVDNAEAVTQLIETEGQTISLVVSEKDKELRIERPEQKHKEAV